MVSARERQADNPGDGAKPALTTNYPALTTDYNRACPVCRSGIGHYARIAAVLGNGEIVENSSCPGISMARMASCFWPPGFTFVCPSEILAYDERMPALATRNTKLAGIGVGSGYVHLAWRETPVNEGGSGSVGFPMVADPTKTIVRDYGVRTEAGVALRGTFLLDRDGVVRHHMINDLSRGLGADEAVRLVEALQFHEEFGNVYPADWKSGAAGMTATPDGVARHLSEYTEAF